MVRLIRALLDGLVLRCPNCHRGRMFETMFRMRRQCPVCGQPFERASGEVTGGMGINIVVTLFIVIVAALVIGLNPTLPLVPLLLALSVFAVVFPIVFYPVSRGLWASIIYITGDVHEPD